MRAAPPAVEFPLGSGRRERGVAALLYAAASAAFTAWLVARFEWTSPAMLTALVAAAGAVLGWSVLPPLQGRLAWDGAGWSHSLPGTTLRQPLEAVFLQIDLGHWLLLRVRRQGRKASAWCGVSAAEVGGAWHGARLALYFRAPLPALPSGPR